jgi:hypothetical protein
MTEPLNGVIFGLTSVRTKPDVIIIGRKSEMVIKMYQYSAAGMYRGHGV